MGYKISFSPGFTKADYLHLLANGVTIQGRRVGPASLFIEVQPGRPEKLPLFLVGTLMLKLIQNIAKDHPIYCAPASWFMLSNPERYISDAAAILAREILSIEPGGHYLLGGYCFNGWISYEIARILTASEKSIDFLFFIDDRAPHRWPRSLIRPIKRISARMCKPFTQIKGTDDTSPGRFIMESDDRQIETPSSILAVRTAAANHYKNGRPRHDGNIDIFLCDNGSWTKNFLDRIDWKRLIRGKSRIRFIQGSHEWANQTQLENLGRIFGRCLVDAQNMAGRRKSGIEKYKKMRRQPK
jgi:surfactin synthase thioesterase subunit